MTEQDLRSRQERIHDDIAEKVRQLPRVDHNGRPLRPDEDAGVIEAAAALPDGDAA